jgi:hypothetical protein
MGIEGISKKTKNNRSFSYTSAYISMLMRLIILFNGLLIFFSVPYFLIMHVYGETSEITGLNESSLLFKEIKNPISYYTLIEKNYPIPVQQVSKIIQGPTVVYQGIVISENTSNDQLILSRLTNEGDIELRQHELPNQKISFSSLEGNSSDGASFGMDSLNYSGRYVSLNFGNIEKSPESNQISFNFYIRAENSTYVLVLLNGRAPPDGWINNTLYEYLPLPYTYSKLVDLAKIVSSVGDKFSYLDKIQINVEKGTLIDLLTFRINLGKSTINTPGVIDDNGSYFVDGLIFKDKIISTKYHYIIQDWSLKQILDQKFEIDSDDDYIIKSNSWKINEMNEFIDNRTGKTIISLESERNVDLNQLPILEIIQHFDIYHSLMVIGSPKNILFIAVFMLIVLLFYPKVNGIGRR